MVKYRNKYILEGLDEIPPKMLEGLDLAYDACKGLHDAFPCAMCGKCCHQANITLRNDDIGRIAEHLKMSDEEFIAEYLYKRDGLWLFKKTGGCRFLGNDNKCMIWNVRPEICRDFPYLVAKFMSRVYHSIANDAKIDLSYMDDDWPCTPVIKNSVNALIKGARKKRLTHSL
jgi:Fe-S-cluster containining protein